MPAARSGFPLARLLAVLTLAAGAASCLGGQVFSLDPEELKRELRSGDAGFLASVGEERLAEAARLGPGGAYYLSLHYSRAGQDGKAALLLETEWKSGGGQARAEAGRALMRRSALSGDWKNALSLSRSFLSRYPGDPDALYLRLESLVRLGDHSQALALGLPESAYGRGRAPLVRACLAAARLGSCAPGGREAVDALVREERDGGAAALLADLLRPGGSEEGPSLLRARRLVAAREYGSAVADFALLPGLFESAPGPALVSDAGKAYLFGGAAEEGARIFSLLADLPGEMAPSERALAQLYAGRCLLSLGRRAEARTRFSACLSAAPPGPEADAAAWFLIDSAADAAQAVRDVAATSQRWSDARYFDDVLSGLIGGRVGKGDFRALAELESAIGGKASPFIGRRLEYILARARSLGLLPGARDHSPRMPDAQGLDAFSYFPIMSSVLLGGPSPVPQADRAGSPTAAEKTAAGSPTAAGKTAAAREAEAFILGLIEFGLEDEAPAAAIARSSLLSPEFIRSCSLSLASSGRHAAAARLIAGLSERPGYLPSAGDLALLYPRAWKDELDAAADAFGLSRNLLAALARTESFFDPRAVSRAGALGLTQLMPETAREVAARLRIPEPDLFDPGTNARLGAAYLSGLISYFKGDTVKALLSYNGGMGRVRTWARESPGLPPDLLVEAAPLGETREYARKVLAALAVYGYLYDGLPMGDSILGACPGLGGT